MTYLKCILLAALTVLFFMDVHAQSSFTDIGLMDPLPAPAAGTGLTNPPATIPASGVDFFTGATLLADACPLSTALVMENFASSLVPPNSVLGCSFLPLSSTSNDGCYAPGDLEEGFELTSNDAGGDGPDMVIVTTGFLGVPVDVVGANSFIDDVILNFAQPVNSFSFELINPIGTGISDFIVEVFGASGSLGTLPVTSNGNTPVFIGGLASEPITSVELQDVTPSAAGLIGNLTFDLCEEGMVEIVPTMGEWGVICLSIGLLIFSVIAFKERESVIA